MSESVKNAIKAFINHVELLENSKGSDGFSKEYVKIQEIQMRNQRNNVSTMDVGQLESNLKKNRYKDIVPFDDHRVVLSVCEGDECSDYINASSIMGATGRCDYIASQGPLPTTVDDFWRMIWEYNIEIVFMACRLVEMKKTKCSQYWSSVGTSQEFGDITVFTETEEEIVTECVRRNFRVTKGEVVHYVVHFQYCGWPDHGIPENLGDIRDILGIMREMRSNNKAPMLVHCSAGCGRTGAIIAIDYAWTLLEEGKFDEKFNLFNLICSLREQRVSLVQTPDQYALVNKVLKSLCEERLIMLASHTYENVNFDQQHSDVENSQQSAEESDYENIWSSTASSEVKTPVLNPEEYSISITDERYLGRSEKKLETSEQQIEDESALYANTAEVQKKMQENMSINHEKPSEENIHRTFIRVDSITTSTKAKSVQNVELPTDTLVSSQSSDRKQGNLQFSTVLSEKADNTGHREGGDIVRRGATKMKQKPVIATVTASPTPKAQLASNTVNTDYEERQLRSVKSQPAAQDVSYGSRKQHTTRVLPNSQFQRHQPFTDTPAHGFNRRSASLKSRGTIHVPAFSLYQNKATIKPNANPQATSSAYFQRASSLLKSRGAEPVTTSSQYQTAQYIKFHRNVPATPSSTFQRAFSVKSHGTVPATTPTIFQRGSSVKYHEIGAVPDATPAKFQKPSSTRSHDEVPATTSTVYQSAAPLPNPVFYSIPRSSRIRVNTNNNHDSSHAYDNTVVVHRGMHSKTSSHGNQNVTRESRDVIRTTNFAPNDSPQYSGFVRLNSGKLKTSDEGRQGHLK